LAELPDDIVSTGGSCIVGPLGEVLAGPSRDAAEILFADIDLDQIAGARFDFDVVGRYARPDVFRSSWMSKSSHPSSQAKRASGARLRLSAKRSTFAPYS
jgi:nitrilase